MIFCISFGSLGSKRQKQIEPFANTSRTCKNEVCKWRAQDRLIEGEEPSSDSEYDSEPEDGLQAESEVEADEEA